MPNLTPILLSEEEHQRLSSLKHKLEAKSWRDMLMKLCDIYDQLEAEQKLEAPTQLRQLVEEVVEEKLKQKNADEETVLDEPEPTEPEEPEETEQYIEVGD